MRIRGSEYEQDGFVSSLVFFFTITSIPLSFSTIFFMTGYQSKTITMVDYNIMLIIFMVVAMVIMGVMMCSAACQKWIHRPPNSHQVVQTGPEVADHVSRTAPHQTGGDLDTNTNTRLGIGARINEYFQVHVTIIGMGVFYFLGLLDDIGFVVVISMCFGYSRVCHHDYGMLSDFCFHMTRPIFLGALFLFCHRFHGTVLRRCVKVRFCLVTILSATAAVWLDATLYEIRDHQEILERSHGHHGDGDLEAASGNNATTMICAIANFTGYCPNSAFLQQAVDESLSFIYPLHIEMTFLVMELLFHLNQLLTDDTDATEPPDEEPEDLQMVQNDNEALLPQQGPVDNFPNDGGVRNGGFTCFLNVITVLVVLLNMTDLLLAFITRYDSTHRHSDVMRSIYTTERVVYYFSCLLTTVTSFVLCAPYSSIYMTGNEQTYEGIKLLFLFSSLSQLYRTTIEVITAIFCLAGSEFKEFPLSQLNYGDEHVLPPTVTYSGLHIAAETLDGLYIYALTVLVLHAGRVQPYHIHGRRALAFKKTLLNLAIFNFGTWATYGFAESSSPYIDMVTDFYFQDPAKGDGNSTWNNIGFITGPVSLFYRFTATILLVKIYLK